jgi:hypothetical protein
MARLRRLKAVDGVRCDGEFGEACRRARTISCLSRCSTGSARSGRAAKIGPLEPDDILMADWSDGDAPLRRLGIHASTSTELCSAWAGTRGCARAVCAIAVRTRRFPPSTDCTGQYSSRVMPCAARRGLSRPGAQTRTNIDARVVACARPCSLGTQSLRHHEATPRLRVMPFCPRVFWH